MWAEGWDRRRRTWPSTPFVRAIDDRQRCDQQGRGSEQRWHAPPNHDAATLDALGDDAECVERLARGLLLGGLLRRPSPHAELHARNVSCAHETPVVRRPLNLED